MAKKKSEDKEDFWGNKYKQHYDSNGDKDGYSELKEDMWGNKYIQHYDNDGRKIGTSENKEGFWGNEYTEHSDKDYRTTGYSEKKEDFWGNEYTEHSDRDGKKIGYSEEKKDFWGNEYTEHKGSHNRSYQQKKNYTPPAPSGNDSGLVGLVLYLVLGLMALYLVIVAIVIALVVIALISPIALLVYYFVSKGKEQWKLVVSTLLAAYLMIDFSNYIFLSKFLDANLSIEAGLMDVFAVVYGVIMAVPLYMQIEGMLRGRYPYKGGGRFFERKHERRSVIICGIALVLALFLGIPHFSPKGATTNSSPPHAPHPQTGGQASADVAPTDLDNPLSYKDIKASSHLSASDLHQYSRSELRVLRNGIFAKYGYSFQTKEMRSYFARKDWYRDLGRTEAGVVPLMTQMEKDNVQLIKSYESAFNIQHQIQALINDLDGYTYIRGGQTTSSPIIGKVINNQTFTAYKTPDSNWWLVEHQGKRGYMHNSRIAELGDVGTTQTSFYVININAVKDKDTAQNKSEQLQSKGFPSGFLWIPDYNSLSGAEFYSVYIGPYATSDECAEAVEIVRNTYPDAYGTLVSQENKRVEVRGVGKIEEIAR